MADDKPWSPLDRDDPWEALEVASKKQSPQKPAIDPKIKGAFERLFASEDGRLVLAYLRQQTLEIALPPQFPAGFLHQQEGQRALVLRIQRLATPTD